MEESKEIQKLHAFMQGMIYFALLAEFAVFLYKNCPFWGLFGHAVDRLSHVPIYTELIYSKMSILVLICLVSIGTLSKKQPDFDPKLKIVFPLSIGLLLYFGSMVLYGSPSKILFSYTTRTDFAYMACSLIGAILISLSMDNISKIIRSGLGKDKWNVEAESFMQHTKKQENSYSVNIPMLFYFKKKFAGDGSIL